MPAALSFLGLRFLLEWLDALHCQSLPLPLIGSNFLAATLSLSLFNPVEGSMFLVWVAALGSAELAALHALKGQHGSLHLIDGALLISSCLWRELASNFCHT